MRIISDIVREKNPRDVKLWTIVLSLGMLFLFSILVSWISHNTQEEISFFGITMNFHYFIFGVFILLFGLVAGFFYYRYRKAKRDYKQFGTRKKR